MPQQTPPHARTSAHPTAVRGTGTTPKSTPKPTPCRRTADRRTAVLRSRLRKTRSLLPRASDYASAHRTWKGDVLAGITVGIVALPLALAFAVSSGMPPEAGLVTSVVAGFVAAVILLQQVPDALGVEETTRSNPALAAFESFSLVDVPEVAWALGTAGLVAAIMVLAPLLHPSLPGSIIGIVVVTVAAGVLGALLGPACAVATLASIESLLSARVASRLSDAAP